MGSRMERVQQFILTLSALTIAAVLVFRTFQERGAQPPQRQDVAAVHFPAWREAMAFGRRLGGETGAPVVVIEFSDLECPACRVFQSTLESILSRRPRDVQAFYMAYPLPIHRFAMPAARAVECVDSDSLAASLIARFYMKQDSLGIKTWGSFAAEAGVPDTSHVASCALGRNEYARIDSGKAIGQRLRIPGTPSVLINGWLLPFVPTEAQLDSAVNALMRIGRS